MFYTHLYHGEQCDARREQPGREKPPTRDPRMVPAVLLRSLQLSPDSSEAVSLFRLGHPTVQSVIVIAVGAGGRVSEGGGPRPALALHHPADQVPP